MGSIGTVSTRILSFDTSGRPLGVPESLAGPVSFMRLVSRHPFWVVGDPTVSHGALDPTSVAVEAPRFERALLAGAPWAAMMAFVEDDALALISDPGRRLRESAWSLMSKGFLRSVLVTPVTRELSLVTRARTRPLSPLQEAQAYSRVLLLVHVAESLIDGRQVPALPDPESHAELAFAAGGGSQAAIVEVVRGVRATVRRLRDSDLPDVGDSFAVASAVACLRASEEGMDLQARYPGAVPSAPSDVLR